MDIENNFIIKFKKMRKEKLIIRGKSVKKFK